MRKFFSAVLLYLLIPLLALFIIFLFWGSAGQLRRSQLSQIKNYQYAGVSKRDTLKIMSYNIGYLSGMFNNRPVEVNPELFKANLHKSAELLSKHNPDFIAFQEIDFDADRSGNVHQLDSLAQLANYPYAAIAINWDKNYVLFPYGRPAVHFGQMLSGQAILSKFPVVNQTRIVLPKPEGNYFYNKFYIDRLIQIVQVDVGQPLILMNVHLEAFDREVRKKQMQIVLNKYREYEKNYPVILLGDFNSVPPFDETSDAGEMNVLFEESGLAPGISRETYLEDRSKYFTFSSRNPSRKIDHIFYSSDELAPVSADVLKSAGQISDHLPLMFTFTFRRN